MEMKRLHMGMMSYAFDTMDEVAHQLAMAFGTTVQHGEDTVNPACCLPDAHA
jgi:phospholipid-translocating ATPase